MISIHAPTRGATGSAQYKGWRLLISIHAPTRGATLPLLPSDADDVFQSTLLQEERHFSDQLKAMDGLISIHAPTRGATAGCV